jgi:coenzyme F420-reducing hydrogenase delta subunit
MQPRTDGLKFDEEAVVDPGICTACGICVGACPTATPYRRKTELVPGIELPERTMADVRDELHKACEGLAGNQRVVVFGCDSGTHTGQLAMQDTAVLTLPCIAMLPPSFIDYVLSRDLADGVLLTGCNQGDCYYRLGIEWMDKRIAGERDPYLRKRVPLERVDTFWQGHCPTESIKDQVVQFKLNLKEMNARHEHEE